ncbi:aldose epimerase family protein [Mucilaginibacter jinjuensis]|uniref:Aldose 1-epimerase n=1 Tax=Mucilaginibacter jinjuensis TaxID=1176721 RepID=A0ABY7TGN1_9SPHI|nr:aldose epimerase family protein [Mucilaginibacter jinjuensis]WCT14873.1 galactose mutarotase [Mucilaginibacter jinjuensis]
MSGLNISSVRSPEFPEDYVYEVEMSNDNITVRLTNFGASIIRIDQPDQYGVKRNIVAGFKDIGDYRDNPYYLGCILGRYAGRISNAQFELNNKAVQLSKNDGAHHLHGGAEGFSKKVWVIKNLIKEQDQVGVIMEYLSLDGEEGYPGNLWTQIKYTLDEDNLLAITYNAVSDQVTPVSLSNHSYFNLSGFDEPHILRHVLQVNADYYTAKTDAHLPTGEICTVAATSLDFKTAKIIGDNIGDFSDDSGYNHNFILNDYEEGKAKLAVTLTDPDSGRFVQVYTDQPCVQIYTANAWDSKIIGSQGIPYGQHGAVAIETQFYPDAPNHPGFPKPYLYPGDHYKTKTIYAIGVEEH